MNLKEVIEKVKKEIDSGGDELAEVKARNIVRIVSETLNVNPHFPENLNERFLEATLTMARLQATGIPTAYIEGKVSFCGMEFVVLPGVFIPRQETEILVEFAAEKIRERFGNNENVRILDVGTGTGVIAISLAKRLKNSFVTAIDRNPRAVENAKHNALKLDAANVAVYDYDFQEYLKKTDCSGFEVIVSNPPYVGEFEKPLLPASVVRHEPHDALFGGKTGVEFYDVLFDGVKTLLEDGGMFFFEIGFNQKEFIEKMGEKRGLKVEFETDYSGIFRIAWGIKNG